MLNRGTVERGYVLSYKQIKWLILLLPSLIILIWEELRHTVQLLHYIPMNVGNWLTPLIVLVLTLAVAGKLFQLLERIQKQLEEERSKKMILEEREKIARQLHDGIAQSIFLLSVKLNKVETHLAQSVPHDELQKVKKTVKHIHQDIRQSIFNLRNLSEEKELPWTVSIYDLVSHFKEESNINIKFRWGIQEEELSAKEKIELYACVRESVINAQKHAQCTDILIEARSESDGWSCIIEDNGIGFRDNKEINNKDSHGIDIMRDRANEMNWDFQLKRINDKTRVEIRSYSK